jgi:hypothetical protein
MNNEKRQYFYTSLGYVLIALFVIFVGAALVAVKRGIIVYDLPREATKKWGAFALFTPFIFFTAIRQSRLHWSRSGFWIFIATAFLVHTGVFVVLLLRFEEWDVSGFVVALLLEEPALFYLTTSVMNRAGRRRPKTGWRNR